jgi:hypothetical protein
MLRHSDAPYSLATAAPERVLDRGALRGRQVLAARPHAGRRDREPPVALLVGEQRERGRVTREEGRLERVERVDQRRQRIGHRERARVAPRARAAARFHDAMLAK